MSDKISFKQYQGLGYLVTYGNLYHKLVIEYPAKTEETTDWWKSQDPTKSGDYLEMIHDDDVRWLVEMGYARVADHDPLFARAKVVPTSDGRVRLEHHGLTAESEGVGTHIGHCCKTHGCKYSDRFCPVASGMFKQSYPCESCGDNQERWDEEMSEAPTHMLIEELQHRGYTVTKDEDEDAEG